MGLGVASLVVALALMSGYRRALREGILAASGHLLIVLTPAQHAPNLEKAILSQQGVAVVGRTFFLPGVASTDAQTQGEVVTLKAAEHLPPFAPPLPAADRGPLPVAMGGGLARRLGVRSGDSVVLQLALPSGRLAYLPAKVGAVFETAFAELSESWVLCDFAALERRGGGWGPPLLEVFLRDPDRAPEVAEKLAASLGPGVLVHSWSELNRELFAALRWQKLTLALVLSLIVGVGAFEVASALVVLITERRRELGILLAMGASRALVRQTVVLAGGLVGAGGVLFGALFGLSVVALLSALGVPAFSPELASVYMVSRIPWEVQVVDVAWVVGVGLAEVLVASLAAARPLAAREPAEVLRWV